jgi:hypothetical protein
VCRDGFVRVVEASQLGEGRGGEGRGGEGWEGKGREAMQLCREVKVVGKSVLLVLGEEMLAMKCIVYQVDEFIGIGIKWRTGRRRIMGRALERERIEEEATSFVDGFVLRYLRVRSYGRQQQKRIFGAI